VLGRFPTKSGASGIMQRDIDSKSSFQNLVGLFASESTTGGFCCPLSDCVLPHWESLSQEP